MVEDSYRVVGANRNSAADQQLVDCYTEKTYAQKKAAPARRNAVRNRITPFVGVNLRARKSALFKAAVKLDDVSIVHKIDSAQGSGQQWI